MAPTIPLECVRNESSMTRRRDDSNALGAILMMRGALRFCIARVRCANSALESLYTNLSVTLTLTLIFMSFILIVTHARYSQEVFYSHYHSRGIYLKVYIPHRM